MKFSDDLLTAYINGELAEPARAAVERAMRADPVLAARIAQHRARRSRMVSVSANGHDGSSQPQRQPPPGGAKVVHLDALRPGRAGPPPPRPQPDLRWGARHWAALAGALAVGALAGALGWRSLGSDPGMVTLVERDGALVARGKLLTALSEQLASPGPADGGVRIGVTFVAKDGAYCRSFVLDTTAGLACRSRGRWTIPVLAQGQPGAAYLDGSVLPQAVLDAIEERSAGATLDPVAERAAQQRGWKP
ncbi:hypothetical protein B0920_17460 [Massilia sp. KIM]|uniref:anti-sigma factor family protein n=1 Tax=Massilia sp. KIM TaxID=1955422 RepID=UPI00098FA2F3|nr:hypothetical protein [Massilia sp. KIM]OON60744.1 hypothetical protein B0920_17460 [Massilia sp. KIM]